MSATVKHHKTVVQRGFMRFCGFILKRANATIAQCFSAGFRVGRRSESRQGTKEGSVVPRGTGAVAASVNPAMNGWAIFGELSADG